MTDLESIKGLGPKRLAALRQANLDTAEKLLRCFPQRYEDHTSVTPVSQLLAGEEALVEVRLRQKPSQARVNGRTITRASLYDATGSVAAVWFGQVWMFKQLANAQTLLLYGRVQSYNGRLTLNTPRVVTEREIQPVYKPVEAFTNKAYRDLIRTLLIDGGDPEETLPPSIRERYGLMDLRQALWQVHFPGDRQALEWALRRFGFEETLFFMLAAILAKRPGERGEALAFRETDLKRYISSLPFPLTGAQSRVLGEVASDLRRDRPMARLVQGDVGCGKTAVAFGAIYLAIKAGKQAAMMAPTEILASQHYESAKSLLEPLGVRCGLLIGSMTPKQHREAAAHLAEGSWDAVFGTHALISESVRYRSLALAITDEQHRFGVRQRVSLGEKGDKPHVLVMSATPIPRTLALIMYGDLDVSVIDELPPGRKPVKTRIVPETRRAAMYDFILGEVKKGKQAYFVCPLVEDSELTEAESAENLYRSLEKSALSQVSIGLVHGRQRPEAKEQTLEAFKEGKVQILVSTTVIEVGINVPNATIMVVENAERFGLAQLHQLRGRVGRGTDEAWCFLMTEATAKLKLLTQTNDGFEIAQKDMEQRGPGDIFGTRQSGVLGGLSLDSARDIAMLEEAHKLAKTLSQRGDVEAEALKRSAVKWLLSKNDLIFDAN